MARSLEPIQLGEAIVDKNGAITLGFRQKWQSLIDGADTTPTRKTTDLPNQNAALAATSAYLTQSAGLYRMSYYVRKTVADGVSSAVTVTLGWTESGLALSEAGAALAPDLTTAQQSGSKVVYADESTDLTVAVAYASNTPGAMQYRIVVVVEALT